MYSLVLMMALTGSGEAPAFGHHGCHGCCGGCWGGCHGLFGGHGCHGCCGGYSYGCCGGCYGGCYGGYSYGCCGGGWGGSSYGCCGGGCYGGYTYGGCYGGYYGCCGGGYAAPYMAPAGAPPGGPPPGGGAPAGGPEKTPKPPVSGGGDKEKEVRGPAPATITVSLPADAKLMIDDTATRSTSATRTFVSPSLTPGQEYHYTLKAEIVREGRTLSAMERVTVRAGEDTRGGNRSALRATYGYDHDSRHCRSRSAAWRRLVRPWTLVRTLIPSNH